MYRAEDRSNKKSEPRESEVVRLIGIAADEPIRIERQKKNPNVRLPLVEVGWTEADAKQWCIENGLLSPLYTEETLRGGCWFCHNQGVNQLRLLRKNYPEYWKLMLKWDTDSPVSFHPDGHTVHDFDKRFALEDAGIIAQGERWNWDYLRNTPYNQISFDDLEVVGDILSPVEVSE